MENHAEDHQADQFGNGLPVHRPQGQQAGAIQPWAVGPAQPDSGADGKLENNTFKFAGTQSLNTALGKLNTVRLDRVRESSDGKSTSIWFASDRNFVPVLFQQLDENGDDIEMRILAIK